MQQPSTNHIPSIQFHDDLVARGIPGGEEAAKRLLASVMDTLRYEADFRHGDPIVVRLYANIKNLSNTYVKYDLLEHRDQFADFVVGFNKIHPDVDFIDAGNAKGGADRKVLGKSSPSYFRFAHCRWQADC